MFSWRCGAKRAPDILQVRRDSGGLATMAGTSTEPVAAQTLFSHSLFGGGRNRRLCSVDERFRQHHCLPRRTVGEVLDRVAREYSREPLVWKPRPPCQRLRWHMCDVTLFDGSRHLVA